MSKKYKGKLEMIESAFKNFDYLEENNKQIVQEIFTVDVI